ncbi:MAG: valine--tRNA ligase [Candidatus Omnitrophica bacterium]|nr:valine--tRNA ligase [Candidatus Omnitrophota bacterium]
MNPDIPTRYNPEKIEEKWYDFWQRQGLFHAEINSRKSPYTIMIPPPNVTGILHMGHALNNTYQDVLIRFARMAGYETLWMPGTDHAGIATQNVVEKAIAKQGLRRQDLGREKFLREVWKWKEEYGLMIIHQLKKIGASCDWSRTRFTMDEDYSYAVKEVFIKLWNKGLIYQDDKVINWCPRCLTALSDEEAPYSELKGNLYYLKYPFQDRPDEFIIVATTRPETMLGDTAVAVNPKDKRYNKFIGKTLILPLINREIKIIADSIVDKEFGTGAVKVTPAHDPNDESLGKRHNLEFVNVMHPDASMNERAGKYKGLDRFKARQMILEDLKTEGLLEKIEDYQLSAGHCYRCHTIIEPYLSRQWFVKMKALAKPAILAVKKGKIKFYPQRWTKVYLNWMENIRDWCISRQIWWGHRLPIWYCLDCKGKPMASIEHPKACLSCKSTNLKQDEDVLDTWFSSWLWSFATFGWPSQSKKVLRDLKYFYPTDCLVTAPEIIFFWVARMIMAGLEFMKDIPFNDVYIHGTVRDIEGKKMSKSLGNIIDPLEVINEYGADVLRFSLASFTATGQDIFLSKEKFQMGRNFANKIWNASRFILMNMGESKLPAVELKDLNLAERWILSRLQHTIARLRSNLGKYNFSESAKSLYEFFWHEFCDWFIEIAKDDVAKGRLQTKAVLIYCMSDFLKLLHPFMPFITEEISSLIKAEADNVSIMYGPYPEVNTKFIDSRLESEMAVFMSLVKRVRDLRADLGLDKSDLIDVLVSSDSKKDIAFLESLKHRFKELTKSKSCEFAVSAKKPPKAIADVEGGLSIYIPFAASDTAIRLKTIEKRIALLTKNSENIASQLKNKQFLAKAPKDVLTRQRDKLQVYQHSLKKLKEIHRVLK